MVGTSEQEQKAALLSCLREGENKQELPQNQAQESQEKKTKPVFQTTWEPFSRRKKGRGEAREVRMGWDAQF